MYKQKVLHSGGLLVMALAIVAAANCAVHGTIDPGPSKAAAKSTAPTTVLVFCDRTPGSFFWADTWQQVAERSGEQLAMTTTLEDFFSQLKSKQWSAVKVLARWSSGEPAFAAPLMAYANANPRQHIMMFLWHDNGAQLDPKIAVLPSTVMVTWQARMTVIGFSGFRSDDPKKTETKAIRGLALADLEGLRAEPPVAIGPITEQPGGRGEAIIIVTPCESACAKTYNDKVAQCNSEHNVQLTQCNGLYGPGSDPDDPEGPGDPEAYAQCIGTASNNHSNCVSSASSQYKNCVALCKKANPAPPPEPVPPSTGL